MRLKKNKMPPLNKHQDQIGRIPLELQRTNSKANYNTIWHKKISWLLVLPDIKPDKLGMMAHAAF